MKVAPTTAAGVAAAAVAAAAVGAATVLVPAMPKTARAVKLLPQSQATTMPRSVPLKVLAATAAAAGARAGRARTATLPRSSPKARR